MLHVFEENLSVADKYGFRQADIKNINREGIKSKVVLYRNSFSKNSFFVFHSFNEVLKKTFIKIVRIVR